MQHDQNPLATKSIGKLIATYAIPSIISMVVNALYNIVDQIFIGHGVGYLGNAATTIAFPVITIGMAVALIFGNGGAAYTSLKFGEKDTKEVNAVLGTILTCTTVIIVGFCIFAAIFLDPFLYVLGATENTFSYSYDYVSIILVGMPFVVISTMLSSIIRADGSPVYSMMCVLAGAVLNTILDPIFIFTFDMGVKGAAIATAISQMVSFVVAISYFNRRSKHVFLRRDCLKPRIHLFKIVTALGFSSFVTQMAITFVNIVLNNSLRHYGGLSSYGSDIPLSAMGIVLKINAIMISVMIGISIGAQPILGYNYGARHYLRVRQTYLRSILIATIVAFSFWLLFRMIPELLVQSFGDNSADFVEFGSLAFRTFLGGAFIAGFQIVSAQYFQATGRPMKASLLSMSRQIILLIPFILLLGYIFGLMGVLYAGVVSDLCAAAITAIFILLEMKRLNGLIHSPENQPV